MSDGEGGEEGTEGTDRQEAPFAPRIVPDGGMATLDEILESLTSPRRRFVLYYLQDHEIATVEELAHQIVAHEQDVPAEAVANADSDHIASQLVHSHLPNLAAATFIEYDQRSSTVRYREPSVLLEAILRLLARLERDSRGRLSPF